MPRLAIGVAFHSPFYAPLFVARHLGHFVEEGLDVTIAAPPPGGTVDMLESGRADLILSGVMRTFILADHGRPHHVAIAEVNSRDGFFLLSRQPEPNFSLRDLEGKRLALFGLAPTPWMCLKAAMREHGADPARVQVLEKLDPDQGVEALRSGRADYLQTGQPVAEQLILGGAAWLAAPQAPVVGHVPYSSFIVTDQTRRMRPELCSAAVLALTRSLVWIREHDGDAIAGALASEFPDTPERVMSRAVQRMKDLDLWSDGPRQDAGAFNRLGKILADGGLIGRAAPYTQLNDDSFAEQAVAWMGRR